MATPGNLYPGYNSHARVSPIPPEPATSQAERWVLGVAGGGLVNAAWAHNADVANIGRKGELRTADILDALSVSGSVAVLHDLRIPIPGINANIDHILVSGNRILIVDTKVWKPGFFWTLGATSRRGTAGFASADKKTMLMAAESIGRYLASHNLGEARIETPVVAVWASHDRARCRLWALRMPGADIIHAERLARRVRKFLRRAPADPAVVAALAELLVTPARRPPQSAPPRSAPTQSRYSSDF